MTIHIELTITAGPMAGRVFSFDRHDILLFGRAKDCHARLPDDDLYASRHHFLLELNPPAVRIRDLGSLNGTYVNGAKVGGRSVDEQPQDVQHEQFPQIELNDGNEIRVGTTTLQLRLISAAADEACDSDSSSRRHANLPDATGKQSQTIDHSCASPIVCQLCVRDVTEEVPGSLQGRYICQSCRDSFTYGFGGVKELIEGALGD